MLTTCRTQRPPRLSVGTTRRNGPISAPSGSPSRSNATRTSVQPNPASFREAEARAIAVAGFDPHVEREPRSAKRVSGGRAHESEHRGQRRAAIPHGLLAVRLGDGDFADRELSQIARLERLRLPLRPGHDKRRGLARERARGEQDADGDGSHVSPSWIARS
jgi:hypothetical protein